MSSDNEAKNNMKLDYIFPSPPTSTEDSDSEQFGRFVDTSHGISSSSTASPLVKSRNLVPCDFKNQVNYALNISDNKRSNSILIPERTYLHWNKPKKTIIKRCQRPIPESPSNLRYGEKKNGGWIKYTNEYTKKRLSTPPILPKANENSNNNKIIRSKIEVSSILTFSKEDMHAMAHAGINITKLIMQDWANSLVSENKYFSSYFVFGQVKWREAVTATATLGRPNPFLTRAAFSIFATASEEFGTYRMILTFLLDKLSECCFANYSFINTPLPTSFFDGLTHQEYLHYLERSIEELGSKFVEIEEWEEEARKEKIRTNVMFDSIVNIWSKGILGMSMLKWRKYHQLMQKNLRRISYILRHDHHDRRLDHLWWYFNRWHTHHTKYIHNRHDTNAIMTWKLYHETLHSNKLLNEYVHTSKVEVQDLEKQVAKTKEKKYKLILLLEQIKDDWDAMRKRENFWIQYAAMWNELTVAYFNYLIDKVYTKRLREAYLGGIEMIAPPLENVYVKNILPIFQIAGYVDIIKHDHNSYPICSRVLRLKNAEVWLSNQQSSTVGGGNKVLNLLFAMPGYPPVVEIEEGTELERNISNLKNELATLTAFMPTAEVVDESKVQIGTGKLKKKNNIANQWKNIAGLEKNFTNNFIKLEGTIIDSEEDWNSLKSAGRSLEHKTWIQLSTSIAHFKGHISLHEKTENKDEKARDDEDDLLEKRHIDERRFAHIARERLYTLINMHAKKHNKNVLDNSVEEEGDRISEYLREHVYDIKDTFKMYAGTDGGISCSEFIKFCKDIKIFDKKVNSNAASRMFISINLNSDDVDGVDKEMDTHEFLQGVVTLASMRFKEETTLYACIFKIIDEHIIPYGEKVDLDTFKGMVKDPKIMAVVRSYRGWLKKTFRKAADNDSSQQSSNASSTMSVKEFVIYAKSMNLMRGRLSNGDLEALFARVQVNDGSDDEEEEGEMIYGEFEEGVLALCCYEYPNPHVPFLDRLKKYFYHLKSGTIGKKVEDVITLDKKKGKR